MSLIRNGHGAAIRAERRVTPYLDDGDVRLYNGEAYCQQAAKRLQQLSLLVLAGGTA